MKVKVCITLKQGVLDPQGKTVQKSLENLGFKDVKDVRVGKYIEVQLADTLKKEEAQKQIQKMCERLLANIVIENYTFHI